MSNIMLTDVCNLRCPYCFANDFVNQDVEEITIENFKIALDFIADGKDKIGKFGLIGGEPTLHSRFREILQILLADERLTKVILFTNGLEIDKYLEELSSEKIHLLINFNSPETLGQAKYEKLCKNLELLYERKGLKGIRLGINVYKPDFEYEYMIPILKKYGFDNVRFSITVPNEEALKSVHPHAYYNSIKKPFLEFYERMLSMDVLPMFDCNKIPVCLFTVEELEPIFLKFMGYPEVVMNERHFLLSEWSKCSPVIDIRHDLTAVRCFGLSDCSEVHISDFSGLSELEDYYIAKYDERAFEQPYYESCKECTAREWKQCMASCMAYRIDSLLSEEKANCLTDGVSNEPLYQRFLKCYMKNKVFRGVTDEIADLPTMQAFIQGLEKKEYDITEIQPIYEKIRFYQRHMEETKEDRKRHRICED